MIQTIQLQSKIDEFLERKLREYPDLERPDDALRSLEARSR